MKSYITQSLQQSLKERREYQVFGHTNVYIKDALPQNMDMTSVLATIEKSIPDFLFYDIDAILVGQFDDLNSRGVKAAYMDGAIYVTNDQTDNDDLVDDIVHEVAHSVEKMAGRVVYSDGALEQEFLGKKQRFLDILSGHGYNISNDLMGSGEYSQEFDEFVFFNLGFEKAGNMTRGLFIVPYASISLSEYFATGFEAYFLRKERKYLSQISPILFRKLEELTNYSEETY